jgi:hypothetical protein
MDAGLDKDATLADIATESPLTGVVVGVELAWHSLRRLRQRGVMHSTQSRDELQGLLAASMGSETTAGAHFHDNDIHDNEFHFGLDPDTVKELIRLAQGRDDAA